MPYVQSESTSVQLIANVTDLLSVSIVATWVYFSLSWPCRWRLTSFDCGKVKKFKLKLDVARNYFGIATLKLFTVRSPMHCSRRFSHFKLIKICISSQYRYAWLTTKEFSVMDWKSGKLNWGSSWRLLNSRSFVFCPTGETKLILFNKRVCAITAFIHAKNERINCPAC